MRSRESRSLPDPPRFQSPFHSHVHSYQKYLLCRQITSITLRPNATRATDALPSSSRSSPSTPPLFCLCLFYDPVQSPITSLSTTSFTNSPVHHGFLATSSQRYETLSSCVPQYKTGTTDLNASTTTSLPPTSLVPIPRHDTALYDSISLCHRSTDVAFAALEALYNHHDMPQTHRSTKSSTLS